jgi:glycosyltransferase involved in cell wall biosynthesis
MPCRNAEGTIRPAVKSILDQTFDDFEVLVIDESTDQTPKIVNSFKDERIRILQANRSGFATALNLGVRAARGEYIARMDADDVSLPDRLLIGSAYLDSHRKVGMVAGQAFFRCENGLFPSPFACKLSSPLPVNRMLLDVNPIVASASMMRKTAVIGAGGFDSFFDRWRFAEDYDLAVRIAKRFQVMLMPEYVCIYTVSSSYSLTTHLPRIDKLMGLLRAKLRTVTLLSRDPIDVIRVTASVIRSVEIELICRFIYDEPLDYFLNMRTLGGRL